MSFIKVEVTENKEENFTSLLFVARDDDGQSRLDLDTLMRCLLDTSLQRRGGFVPGNALRVDVKLPSVSPVDPSEAPLNNTDK